MRMNIILTDCAWSIVIGVTSAPRSDLNLHRSLWILSLSVLWFQSSDSDPVDLPHDLIACPVDRIFVKPSLIVRARMKGSSVVCSRLALAEIVALDLCVVGAQPFPVNFVEVVGL